MAAKTHFSEDDFQKILSEYRLGSYITATPTSGGTVQTNFFLDTTHGKMVFRSYNNRSRESVIFECHLLTFLKAHHYPSPAPYTNRHGKFVGQCHGKPYVIFEFMSGHPVEEPTQRQREQLIQKAAELHNLTRHYRPRSKQYRWNYGVDLCRKLAAEQAAKLNSEDSYAKAAWVEQQLAALALPRPLPKGICHCDFHFSNVLFQGEEFAALLDFDDANYTYLLFDLVGLIESAAWHYPAAGLNLPLARPVVEEYMKYRPLSAIEQRHLYDVYKLSILTDCIWYFGRGDAEDFYEKRKISFLNKLGRESFFNALFLPS